MTFRSLLGSALLHLTLLISGGVWYGVAVTRDRFDPPELLFAPSRTQAECRDRVFLSEPMEIETSSFEPELPEPVLPASFDPPEQQPTPDIDDAWRKDRLWSEVDLEVLAHAAAPEPTAAKPTPIPEPPPRAYVAAEPRTDRNRPPEYPRSAQSSGHEGQVRLRLRIDAEGRVLEVELLTPCRYPALNRAAVEALREWRYRPALRAGVPAADSIVETIVFRMGA